MRKNDSFDPDTGWLNLNLCSVPLIRYSYLHDNSCWFGFHRLVVPFQICGKGAFAMNGGTYEKNN